MAAENILEPTTPSLPSTNPPSGHHQESPATISDPDDPDSNREAKRRRYCPKALDKVEELLIAPQNSTPNFSFTFDTKSANSSPEVTPKFGSFKFVLSNSLENPDFSPNSELEQDEDEQEEEEEEEESEISGTETKSDSLIEAAEETKQDQKKFES